MPNREERRKRKKLSPPPDLSMDQQAMAFMIIRLAQYFEESMVEAGLTEEQMQSIRDGVTRRQQHDMETGYMIGVPDE